jgi:molybdenum cofactor cytidylyltransferase
LAVAFEIDFRIRETTSAAEVIVGIILAAGASSRMGSPKALLDYRGETFVNRLVRVLSGACERVIVVLGYQADAIRERVEGATIVVNPDPSRGQLSSLQTGLSAVPADAEAVLFTPVDSPTVDESTIARVVEEFRRRDENTVLVIPRFRGKRGHPVCAAREVVPEFLALPPTSQAKEIVNRYEARTLYIEVEDAGVLADIDDPEEYKRLA